jgi:hypothetical protein
MMSYEGAHLVQFDPAAEDAVRKAFLACLEKTPKQVEMAGQKVAVFTVKADRGSWTYLIAQPKPCLLVCATDQSYLEEVLKRASGKPGKRALPDDLAEWKQVDRKARVWAVRHYRKETTGQDASSPLGERHLVPHDPDAVGLVLWYNADADKSVRVRYLSGAKGIRELVNETWNKYAQKGFEHQINPVGPGCVEIVVTKEALDKADKILWIGLMGCLGHYVYL